MLKVGPSSLLVATLGVAAPFALGWGVGAWLLPGESVYVHAFLGATLCATSVGITARVLQDLGRSKGDEARVILGAAVIDDVLGLVVLAVVSGVIAAVDRGGSISYASVGAIVAKAMVFLVGSLAIGVMVTPRLFRYAARPAGRGAKDSNQQAAALDDALTADALAELCKSPCCLPSGPAPERRTCGAGAQRVRGT